LKQRRIGVGVIVAATTLAGLAAAPAANAQVIQSDEGIRRERQNSPQHFALELRFGPYKPDIDSEFAGTGQHPYQDFFGPNRKLMTQVEFDWEIIHHVGTAAIGFAFGYFKETGHNLLAHDSDTLTADTSSLVSPAAAVFAVGDLSLRSRLRAVQDSPDPLWQARVRLRLLDREQRQWPGPE
jgi:hypothetical protein